MECPPGGRCGLATDTVTARRATLGGCSKRGWGVYLATSGDTTWPYAGSFTWPWTWVHHSDAQLDDAEKAELEEQRRLRKRIKELEEEVEILKRFTAYWVKETGK